MQIAGANPRQYTLVQHHLQLMAQPYACATDIEMLAAERIYNILEVYIQSLLQPDSQSVTTHPASILLDQTPILSYTTSKATALWHTTVLYYNASSDNAGGTFYHDRTPMPYSMS